MIGMAWSTYTYTTVYTSSMDLNMTLRQAHLKRVIMKPQLLNPDAMNTAKVLSSGVNMIWTLKKPPKIGWDNKTHYTISNFVLVKVYSPTKGTSKTNLPVNWFEMGSNPFVVSCH